MWYFGHLRLGSSVGYFPSGNTITRPLRSSCDGRLRLDRDRTWRIPGEHPASPSCVKASETPTSFQSLPESSSTAPRGLISLSRAEKILASSSFMISRRTSGGGQLHSRPTSRSSSTGGSGEDRPDLERLKREKKLFRSPDSFCAASEAGDARSTTSSSLSAPTPTELELLDRVVKLKRCGEGRLGSGTDVEGDGSIFTFGHLVRPLKSTFRHSRVIPLMWKWRQFQRSACRSRFCSPRPTRKILRCRLSIQPDMTSCPSSVGLTLEEDDLLPFTGVVYKTLSRDPPMSSSSASSSSVSWPAFSDSESRRPICIRRRCRRM
mmetsp:Transcript_818/g.3375  ORF Transcript_818/g.3375 Transcript_818/m.3375 type:complete len:321 (+) Transcript_818:1587-2549(+)